MHDYQIPLPPAPWAGAAVKPMLPAVAQNLENLYASISLMEDTLMALRGRLSSVLTPEAPTAPGGGVPMPPQVLQSNTAGSVASAELAVRQITNAISEIIDRLEV